MLKFRDCQTCGESHALRPDGRMSIHHTAAGERCEESAPPRPPAAQLPRPAHPVTDDSELDAAHATANDRRRRVDDRPAAGLDRRIYATGGVHTVRGGAPGQKRR